MDLSFLHILSFIIYSILNWIMCAIWKYSFCVFSICVSRTLIVDLWPLCFACLAFVSSLRTEDWGNVFWEMKLPFLWGNVCLWWHGKCNVCMYQLTFVNCACTILIAHGPHFILPSRIQTLRPAGPNTNSCQVPTIDRQSKTILVYLVLTF